ncbi:MAG TPA: hypothetical protein ENJ80_14220 [Gammaproteobacteria bacterium]|nr:hypothetical protein [Gammaproteobacteria bacterium]
MSTTGKFIRLGTLCTLLLASACTSVPANKPPQTPFEIVELGLDDDGEKRRYIVLDDKRYISGPYGDKHDVIALINTIKRTSSPAIISNRALNLPNKPANLMLTVYDFRAPAECGGYTFHVYEGNELQILQFDFPENGKIIRIRDYTQGPTPFVSAGLWGPYDHTDGTTMDMCLLAGDAGKDGMGLMEGGYEIGWITNIVDWKQAELGTEYANAVSASNRCLQKKTALARQPAMPQTRKTTTQGMDKTYRVQPGDTLGSIALKMYGDSSRWIDLYTANSSLIGSDPNKLPDSIVLELP